MHRVESLMYVMVCTRLDIAYAAGVVSRLLSNPKRSIVNVWSGYWDIWKALQICICLLEEVILLYKDFLLQTWEVIWIVENTQQVTFLCWVVQQSVGCLNLKEESLSTTKVEYVVIL